MPSLRNVLPPLGRGLRDGDDTTWAYAAVVEKRDPSSSASSKSSPLLAGYEFDIQAGSRSTVADVFLPPPSTPSPRSKSHGRRQEPGHVRRPKNAFFVFRSEYDARNRGAGKCQQNQLSKKAAQEWNAMTAVEKLPYRKDADRQNAEHKQAHPDYQYSPKRKRGASNVRAAKAAVARSRVASTSATTSRSASARSARATPASLVASTSKSNVAYFPEPLFPRAAPAPRHAAQNAIQCFEWMASLSSPRTPSPSPASSMASSFPSSTYLSSPQMLPYPSLFQPTTDDIAVIAFDPAPQALRVEEGSKDEPIFVPNSPPPTRRYREEPQYGYNAYNAYLPSQFASTVPSVVPFSTTMSAVPSSDMFCQWGMPSQPAAPDLDYMGYSMPEDLAASEHALMEMGYGGGFDDFLGTYAGTAAEGMTASME